MFCSRLTLLFPFTQTAAQRINRRHSFHSHVGLKQLQKRKNPDPVHIPNPNSGSHSKKRKTVLLNLTLLGKSAMAIEPVMGGKGAASAAPLLLTSGASGRVNALVSRRALRSLIMLINAFLLLLMAPFRGRRRRPSAAPAIVASEKPREEKQEGCGGSLRKGATVRVPTTIVPWRSTTTADQDAAARRALAIRRVMQDKDEETVRDFALFSTGRGDTLFTQSWTPVSINIRGVVILLHGLNEHSGRYNDFAKLLNAGGYKVYGMDWIGHGGSDGLHAYVHSLDYAVNDVKLFVQKVVAEHQGLPCFCFGHSTGGAIVLKAVLDPKVEACLAGIVMTSPAVGVQPSHPIFVVLAPIISFLLPRYQVSAANKNGVAVSRDPDALVAKYSDPLVYTGSIRVRTGYEILRVATYLQQNLRKLRAPFLVLHGTADGLTSPEASQKLYEEASAVDKSLKLYEGLLHDLLIEPEREEIMEEIIEWLDCRVEG